MVREKSVQEKSHLTAIDDFDCLTGCSGTRVIRFFLTTLIPATILSQSAEVLSIPGDNFSLSYITTESLSTGRYIKENCN